MAIEDLSIERYRKEHPMNYFVFTRKREDVIVDILSSNPDTSYEDISKILNIPLGSVSQIVLRCKKKGKLVKKRYGAPRK